MFIAVGIGNTNTAIALCEGPHRLTVERRPTDTVKAGDFSAWLDALRDTAGQGRPEGAVLASVVPGLTAPCVDALADFTGAKPLVVDAYIRTDIDFSRYTGLLGSDRIAVCAAAWDRYEAPLIVIDMGTATTFNVVDRNGFFLGGAILPGLRTGLASLSRHTAQLPEIGLKEPPGVIGHNTEECLLAGAYYGTAAMVDGMINRLDESLGGDATVVMTGGNGSAVAPLIQNRMIYEPDLLLEGLAALYRKNRVPVPAGSPQ
mgnify:CR=1 FL=1